jgi:hypothetical protein
MDMMRSKSYLHTRIARELPIRRQGEPEVRRGIATTPGDQKWNLNNIKVF